MIVLKAIVMLCLGYICYSDIRYRAVYWIMFPILAVELLWLKGHETGWVQIFSDAGYALVFLLLQLAILWIYFSIKHKKPIDLTKKHLGLGDVLFLIIITIYFSPVNYILFYIVSLILVLFYAVVAQSVKWIKDKSIPLAGLQAILLAIVIVITHLFPQLNVFEDYWIQNFVNQLL